MNGTRYIEPHFSRFIQGQFKDKIKNIDAQSGQRLSTKPVFPTESDHIYTVGALINITGAG